MRYEWKGWVCRLLKRMQLNSYLEMFSLTLNSTYNKYNFNKLIGNPLVDRIGSYLGLQWRRGAPEEKKTKMMLSHKWCLSLVPFSFSFFSLVKYSVSRFLSLLLKGCWNMLECFHFNFLFFWLLRFSSRGMVVYRVLNIPLHYKKNKLLLSKNGILITRNQ